MRKPRTRLAKLTQPNLFNAVSRRRLMCRLDACRRIACIWISGPPGSGKTTLAGTYLKARAVPTIWYQADRSDSDLASFFQYLSIAAGQLRPRIRLPRFTVEFVADVDGFCRRYFRALFAALPAPAVLVFDNAELLLEYDCVTRALFECVAAVNDGQNVLVISRAPPSKGFSRLAISGRLSHVGWPELRLTSSEAAAVARQRGAPPLSKLDRLNDRCDGWAAGLILLLEGMPDAVARPAEAEEFSQTSLFDYFASEIFDQLDPAVQHVLLTSALLPNVSGEDVRAMSGNPTAAQVLEGLHRRQLFISQRVDSASAFEFHALFREFLLAKLQEIYTERGFLRLVQAAESRLVDRGDLAGAVDLALQYHDWPQATELILELAPSLVARGMGATLRRWIDVIPGELKCELPWLTYWYGVSLTQVDPSAAQAVLVNAEAGFQHFGIEHGRLLCAAAIIEALYFEWSDLAAMDVWIERATPLMSSADALESTDAQLRVYASLLLAMFCRTPRHTLLATCVERVGALVLEDGDADQRLRAVTGLLFFYNTTGNCHRARPLIALGRQLVKTAVVSPANQLAWWVRLAFFEMLHPDEGKWSESMARAESIATQHELRLAQMLLPIYKILPPAFVGDIDGMVQAWRRMRSGLSAGRVLDACFVDVHEALVETHRRNFRAGIAAVVRAVEVSRRSGMFWMEYLYTYQYAFLLAQCGRHAEARNVLGRAATLVAGTFLAARTGEIYLLRAWIEHSAGCLDGALDALREALARSNGTYLYFPRTFPAMLPELFSLALEHSVECDTVRRFIGLYNVSPPSPFHDTWPWSVRIRALGGFSIECDRIQGPATRKPQYRVLELLKMLVASGSNGIPIRTVADYLWPDSEGDAAMHAAYTAVHRLRKLLGSDDTVLVDAGGLALNTMRCWVDVWAFERLSDDVDGLRGNDMTTVALHALAEKLLGLYRGHLFAGNVDGWALTRYETLKTRFRRTALNIAEEISDRAGPDAAERFCARALDIDPLSERLYAVAIRGHIAAGRQAVANEMLDRCARLLRETYGAAPSDELQQLRPGHAAT